MAIFNLTSRPLLSAHPLHYALTLFLFITCLGLYNKPPSIPMITPAVFDAPNAQSIDLTLAQRLERSEQLFQKSRAKREELITKYGQDPESYPTEMIDNHYPAMTVYDFFVPSFNCPFELERIGAAGDGGKWVCGLSRISEAPCVIYSFGINYESSFEAEMLKNSRCSVWGYDFSVDSFGPEITEDLKDRSHFFKYGLAGRNDPNGNPPMFTLQSLMKSNEHTYIDVLKIDIEIFEFEVMMDVLEQYRGKPLPFGQLLIEIHGYKSHFPRARKLIDWFNALEEAGLRPFFNEPNLVYVNYNHGGDPALVEVGFHKINLLPITMKLMLLYLLAPVYSSHSST